MKRTLITSYILVHLCVAVFAIRFWPFTDYPMFGWSYPKREKIHTYFWVYKFQDGKDLKIDDGGYGLGDMQTFLLAFQGNTEKLESVAEGHLENIPDGAIALLLIDRYVYRKSEDSFQIKEDVIYKKSLR